MQGLGPGVAARDVEERDEGLVEGLCVRACVRERERMNEREREAGGSVIHAAPCERTSKFSGATLPKKETATTETASPRPPAQPHTHRTTQTRIQPATHPITLTRATRMVRQRAGSDFSQWSVIVKPARARTHTRKRARPQHARIHSHAYSRARTRAQTGTRTHARTARMHARVHTRARMRMHKHARTRTHTDVHAHAHLLRAGAADGEGQINNIMNTAFHCTVLYARGGEG